MSPVWRAWLLGSIALAGIGLAAPVSAQGLLPQDFFSAPIDPAAPTAIEAEELVFDSVSNVITARGDVVVRVSGYGASSGTVRVTVERVFR